MRDAKLLAAIVAASIAVKIFIALFIINGHSIDEYLYMSTARDFVNTGVFGVNAEPGHDFRFIAPMMALLMSGFYAAFGEVGNLLVAPIAGSLAAIPIFFLTERIVGKGSGKIAAILAVTNPAFFLLNTKPLTESLGILMFSMAALFLYLAVSEKKNRYMLFVFPLAFLTFLTRYPYGILIGAIVVAYLVFAHMRKQLPGPKVTGIVASFILGLMVISPWLLYNYDSFGNILGGPLHQGTSDAGFNALNSYMYIVYMAAVIGPPIMLCVYCLVRGLKNKILMYPLIGIGVVFLIQFFLFSKVVEERYMLPVLPFSIVIAVIGYAMMKSDKNFRKFQNHFLVGVVVLNIAATGYLVSAYSSVDKYEDSKMASEWAKANCGDNLAGNIFSQPYYITGKRVVASDPENIEIDREKFRGLGVSCVIVSEHESPFRDYYSESGYDRTSFGRVHVYKIA